MKYWTVLALLFAVCAVFLAVGRTEEAEDKDDFEEQVLEDVYSDTGDVAAVENALDSVKETSSNDEEDEPSLVKRMPWGRRRRRRFWRRVAKVLRRVCGWYRWRHHLVRWGCRWLNGDEEYPRSLSNDAPFLSNKEVEELLKHGWKKEGKSGNNGS